jgi:Cu(I)/Ag(I) efflux system protein CusF
MKILIPMTALLLTSLTACGQQQPAGNSQAGDTGQNAKSAEAYTGTGRITAISGDQITIDHGPVDAIGWPAMTMTFAAPPGVAEGVDVGSNISFDFSQQGSTYVLTSLQKI